MICSRPIVTIARHRVSANQRQMALCMIALSTLTAASLLFAQPVTDEQAPADSAVDMTEGRRLLAGLRDDAFTFDDPAFYWFCRWVRQDRDVSRYKPRSDEGPIEWRFLMERPGDYRGELVTIEGKLLRRESFEVPNREGVGRLTQCDLTRPGTRAVCTAILTDPGAEAPIGSIVRVRGYFIKNRSFRTTTNDAGAGPLIVSRDFEAMGPAQPVGDPMVRQSLMFKWMIAATGLLGILWIALRRISRGRENQEAFSGVETAPEITQTDADFDWLTDAEPRTPEDDSHVR